MVQEVSTFTDSILRHDCIGVGAVALTVVTVKEGASTQQTTQIRKLSKQNGGRFRSRLKKQTTLLKWQTVRRSYRPR